MSTTRGHGKDGPWQRLWQQYQRISPWKWWICKTTCDRLRSTWQFRLRPMKPKQPDRRLQSPSLTSWRSNAVVGAEEGWVETAGGIDAGRAPAAGGDTKVRGGSRCTGESWWWWWRSTSAGVLVASCLFCWPSWSFGALLDSSGDLSVTPHSSFALYMTRVLASKSTTRRMMFSRFYRCCFTGVVFLHVHTDKSAAHHASAEGVVLSDIDLKWREQRMEWLQGLFPSQVRAAAAQRPHVLQGQATAHQPFGSADAQLAAAPRRQGRHTPRETWRRWKTCWWTWPG